MLLERAELAAGASGRNHGLLLSPLDPELIPMSAASSTLYDEIEPVSPIPLGLDPRPIGFLVVAADASESGAARSEAESAAAGGVRIEPVTGEDLRRLEPSLAPDLAEGWLLDDGRRLDPAALTVALGLLAGQHGADVASHVTVRALHMEGHRVRGVVTDEGLVPADAVVLAAGPWSGSLLRPLGIHLPLTGARGWLVHLAPERPVLSRLINRAGWHILGEESGQPPQRAEDVAAAYPEPDLGTLLQQNPDGTLLAGGSRQPVVTPEPEDPGVPRRILQAAIRLVPSLSDATVLSAWWGIRPMTPDGRPIVGPVRNGLVVATGHGGQGVILGGGTATLAASMVLGDDPPFDPAPYAPARFHRPQEGSANP
jgi:sarcosine oxidase subunit beta